MEFRKTCFTFYWKAQSIIAPSLRHSQTLYEEILFSRSNNIKKWLDLGCGHQLLPPWRLEQETTLVTRPEIIVGIDYDYWSLSNHKTINNLIRGDITRLPFRSGTFDLVTSNMVFEHLSNPGRLLKEVFRVLRPGKSLIFHTPNSVSYGTILAKGVPERIKSLLILFFQGRMEKDVFPTYYRVNTKRAINKLAKDAGFTISELRLVVSSAQFVMIPPIVIPELLLIRFLMTPLARRFRTNIIAVLTKSDVDQSGHTVSNGV
jgi:ubiquinone/menaquinone biosynthesis C-methylase UbiE